MRVWPPHEPAPEKVIALGSPKRSLGFNSPGNSMAMGGITIDAICTTLHISRATYYWHVAMRKPVGCSAGPATWRDGADGEITHPIR